MSNSTPTAEHLKPYQEAINGLQRIGRICWERGWSRGTSSNYSVVVESDPLTILVTASGKDKGNLGPDDFVLVDEAGKPLYEGQPKSSAETLLHCVAAKQDHVGAILHTHSLWSTILSDRFFPAKGILIDGFEMLKGLRDVTTHQHSEWVPIFENTQDIPTLAEQVETYTESTQKPIEHGYLIRKHGLYTWGSDLDEAFRQIEIFEFLFECLGHQAIMR